MAVSRKRAALRAKAPALPRTAELACLAARLADDKKAEDIVILDLTGHAYVTDYFVVASAGNPRQLQAVIGAVRDGLLKEGARPIGSEGTGESRWMLLDYGDFVIHVFDPEWRKLYDLELLWGDLPRLAWTAPRRTRAPKPPPPA
jgi:ribosome-associated protein